MTSNFYLSILIAICIKTTSFAQVNITDADIEAGATLSLTADTEYTLDGYVYVEDGATLEIEAGTVIKCKGTPSTGDLSTALIIARGGKIIAEGTADAPIIFTSVEDDLSTTDDLGPFDFQKWGGIVILGKATVGEEDGVDFIEGIPQGDMRSQYGGGDAPDDADNSGVMKYVSLRHGGAVLEQDSEINGLTLGGVGSGTEISYVEVFSSKDDGIEIFGGTVSIDHAVVSYVGDDSYDFDESWNGSMQYLFSLQQDLDGEFGGDHAIEYDGSEREDKGPKTVGKIYNATFIGAGVGSANGESSGIILKSNGAAEIWNSLILMSGDYALAIDSASFDRVEAGEIALASNIITGYADYAFLDEPTTLAVLDAGNNDRDVDPELGGISRLPDGGLDPRPNAGSPALSGAAMDDDAAEGIMATSYRGAFDNGSNWALGWTAMDAHGFFGDLNEKEEAETGVIVDASIEAGETLTLTADVDWEMDGYVYVEDGATLVIEPGTVIRARGTTTTGDLSTALIIARGGKIIAEGTAEAPIIFTSVEDDLSTTDDLSPFDFQKWGGIVILGKATVGEEDGVDFIEGIPQGDMRSQYGGGDTPDDADNSGVMKYVSLRHGGAVLEQDSEINGLTLGGVGSGTEISYVEVFSSKDDGIEIFGGTVNIDHAVVAYVGDDSYDFDESWNGSMQYLFSLQQDADGEFGGDHAIEYDGSEREDKGPKTVGKIYNATFIGAGVGSANGESSGILIKSNGAAEIWNSLILMSGDYAIGVDVASFDRVDAGEIAFANNIITDYLQYARDDDPRTLALLDMSTDKDVDPMLGGISSIPGGGLDPRPNSGSPALSGAATDANAAPGIEAVSYRGAFDNEDNWALGWTAMDAHGFFGDLVTTSTLDVVENDMGFRAYPNPLGHSERVNLAFDLAQASEVSLEVIDMTGKLVDRAKFGNVLAGSHNVILNSTRLEKGIYVLALITEVGISTHRLVVASAN